MRVKDSKIYKFLSSIAIGALVLFNSVYCYGFVEKPRQRTGLEIIEEFIEDHFYLIGVLVGIAIIVFSFFKMRKDIEEAKKKKTYPADENQNGVAKELKSVESGFYLDYFFTFLMGASIIILSIIANI